MKRTEQARYDMLKRVRDFGAAHQALFPESSAGGHAMAAIARVVAAIDTHAKERVLAAKEGRHTRRVARRALRTAMLDIVRTARAASLRAPGEENKFVMPSRGSTASLLTAARTFIDEGHRQIERLVPLGLAPTAFVDLGVLADTLEAEVAGRANGRTSVAHHQAGIGVALAEGIQAVRMLDAVVANVLKADPALYAGWERARRVVVGSSRRSADGEPPPASVTSDAPVVAMGAAPGAAAEEPADAAVPIAPERRVS